MSEIKGQEVDIVMITEVEDVRIASTLLPLNLSARPEGRFACEELFNFSTFPLELARFDISKNFSTDSGG